MKPNNQGFSVAHNKNIEKLRSMWMNQNQQRPPNNSQFNSSVNYAGKLLQLKISAPQKNRNQMY